MKIKNLCFLLVFCCFAHAQNKPLVDSLETLLKTAADTTRIKLLNKLSFQYHRSKPEKAKNYADEALALGAKVGFKKGIAKSLKIIGIVYWQQGNYDKAINYYLRSLRISEELGDKNGIASNLNNIGLVYRSQGNYEKSIDYYFRSLKIDKELDDKKGIASSLNNIGIVYSYQGNYDKAIDYFLRSLKIEEELGNKQGISESLNNIGEVYKEQGNYDKAMEYYLRSGEISEELDDRQGIALNLINIGDAYRKQGNYDMAIEHANRSLSIAREIGFKELVRYTYETLSTIYAKQSRFQQAYEYYQLYSEVKDSILNKESSKQINEMEAKYESEKKERQIEAQAHELDKNQLELDKNRIRLYGFSGGLGLVLIVIFVVFRAYRQKKRAKDIIEQKNKDITDSIQYAKRIQQAIAPPEKLVQQYLKESFILYKPKDIVSGDFYWIEQKDTQIIFAAADCTGHGIPGAFMSIVGANLLKQAVKEKQLTQPAAILNELNKGVTETLRQRQEEDSVKDGMDIALCTIDYKKQFLEYAGAYNPLYLIRNNEITEIKADRQPIGIFIGEELQHFTNHKIKLQKGDQLYIFSDGYVDQFGGTQGKKFKSKQFKELLLSIQNKSMQEQEKILNQTLEKWQGTYEQTDDICVIGVKIN